MPGDVFPTTQMGALFVHERVVDILEEAKITGWEAFSVEVYDKSGHRHEAYSGLRIEGRCGQIQDWRSQPLTRIFPAGPSEVWVGVYFDLDSWDGSDIFVPAGSSFIVVTDRLRKLLEPKRLRHLEFRRLPDIQRILLEPPSPPAG